MNEDYAKQFAISLYENKKYIYHNTLGRGKIVKVTDKYVYIKFESEDEDAQFCIEDIQNTNFFSLSKKKEELTKTIEKTKYIKDKNEELRVDNTIKHVRKEINENERYDNMLNYSYYDSIDVNSYDIKKHRELKKILDVLRHIEEEPYFARVDYNNEKIYIGKNGHQISDDNIITDWRSEKAQIYYNYKTYMDYRLSLIWDYTIKKYKLQNIIERFNNKNGVIETDDKYLTRIIEDKRGHDHAKDIIATIQKNQYDLIKYDYEKDMQVLGCAGSGKTMILLHRISDMAFNYENFNIKDIFVISPNKLINLENTELTQELNLNGVNRFCKNEFYLDCIKKYRRKFDINKLYKEKEYINEELDEDAKNKIYNRDFLNNYWIKVKNITEKGNNKDREIFTRFIYNKLKSLAINFFDENINNYDDIKRLIENSNYINIYNEICDISKKIPLDNIVEYLRNNKNKNDEKIDFVKYIDQKIGFNPEIPALYNTLGRKYVDPSKIHLKELFDLVNGNYSKVKRFIDLYVYYISCVNYINNNCKDIVEEINEYLINEFKKEAEISGDYYYELLLKVITYRSVFGSLDDNKKFIFIDEFQDFNRNELKTFSLVYSNATINFYGDYLQNINNKGITKEEFDSLYKDIKTFSINENYRNPKKVTEFVNKSFNQNMLPIGLDGTVSIISYDTLKIRRTSKKTVLIIKDLFHATDIIHKIKCKYKIIKDDEQSFIEKGLNIMPVNLVKGLEFDDVYVYDKDFTQNEKYVAYTRTLKNLYIIR